MEKKQPFVERGSVTITRMHNPEFPAVKKAAGISMEVLLPDPFASDLEILSRVQERNLPGDTVTTLLKTVLCMGIDQLKANVLKQRPDIEDLSGLEDNDTALAKLLANILGKFNRGN